MTNSVRELQEVLTAQAASDGDGVKLKRVFGGNDLARFDPFLMLDEFGSESAADYIGGFPPHPHRGFETVTYMLEGYMEHRDHMQNVGKLGPGDVQWMKAGSGVIHSEMPQQEEGRMRGFQLWVNLPAEEKMTSAEYQDISASAIPVYKVNDLTIKAIAGSLRVDGEEVSGYVNDLTTEPGYLDIAVENEQTFKVQIPDGHNLLVYVYEGSVTLGDSNYELEAGKLARLSHEGDLLVQADSGTNLLVISGKPLNEPIVHYGPFVMNTMQEIEQAVQDYNSGRLTAGSA